MEPRVYEPDFIERNGTWILSMVGVMGACVSGLLMYMIKSRCRNIKCCGAECDREVVALEPTSVAPRLESSRT
jgi:hypothetical protein